MVFGHSITRHFHPLHTHPPKHRFFAARMSRTVFNHGSSFWSSQWPLKWVVHMQSCRFRPRFFLMQLSTSRIIFIPLIKRVFDLCRTFFMGIPHFTNLEGDFLCACSIIGITIHHGSLLDSISTIDTCICLHFAAPFLLISLGIFGQWNRLYL